MIRLVTLSERGTLALQPSCDPGHVTVRSGHVTTYRDRPRPSRMPLSRPSSLVGPVPSAPQVQYKNAYNADQTVPARAPRQSPFCRHVHSRHVPSSHVPSRHVPSRHAPGWAVARAPTSRRTSSLGTYLISPSRHVPSSSLSRHVPHQLLNRGSRARAQAVLQNQRVALEGAYDVAEVRMKTKKYVCILVVCYIYILHSASAPMT